MKAKKPQNKDNLSNNQKTKAASIDIEKIKELHF
jgi:hypothetical protein